MRKISLSAILSAVIVSYFLHTEARSMDVRERATRHAAHHMVAADEKILRSHTSVSQQAERKAWGKHGMLVFGGERYLYASHLPMFHAPHDYQVIFRFHIEDPASDQQLRSALRGKTQVWTLDPEQFDLARFESAAVGQTFLADFYLGHFEREGQMKLKAQSVVVDQVLLFRPLSNVVGRSPVSDHQYLLLPDGSRYFAMKQIDQKPDIDVLFILRGYGRRQFQKMAIVDVPIGASKLPSRAAWKEALRIFDRQFARRPELVYLETEYLK